MIRQQLKIQKLDAELKSLKEKETKAKELLEQYEQQAPIHQHEEQ